MSAEQNFSNEENRSEFFRLLREFGGKLLFLALLVFALAYIFDIYRPYREVFVCDAEDVKMHRGEAHFFCQEHYFAGAERQDGTVAHSGTNSLLLDKGHSTGMDFRLSDLTGNEHFKVSFWKYGNKQDINLTKGILDVRGKMYRGVKENVETDENGWVKTEMSFEPAAEIRGKDLHFYILYQGQDSVWVDDLRVEVERKREG